MDFAGRLADTKHRIAMAAQAAGRAPESVALVAVSKQHPESAVREALAAGQRCFGENRVQEAWAKFTPLRRENVPFRLHLIGPLQTNKVADAVALFDVIETLDRPRLAEALAKALRKPPRRPELFIQVNTGREPQKAGVWPEDLDSFHALCRDTHGLAVTGLMAIPPQAGDPVPHFVALGKAAERLGLPCVSMGMSADFEQAVRCGATHVRIGSALFGARESA